MKKNDLVEKLHKDANLSTKKQAQEIVDWFFETVTASLKKGEAVEITGFGKFFVNKRAARQGVNPKTGEKIQIAAAKVAKFKAGNLLKEAVR